MYWVKSNDLPFSEYIEWILRQGLEIQTIIGTTYIAETISSAIIIINKPNNKE